jgi:hypothetical protein
MDLVCGTIDLLNQSLKINCAAGPRSADHQFHTTSVISSEAEGEVEKSLNRYTSRSYLYFPST